MKKKPEKLDQKNCYISTSDWKHCLEAGQKDLYSLQILRDKQMLDLYCQRNGLSSARPVEEVLDLHSVHNNVQINDDFFKADRPKKEGPVCIGRSGSKIDASCKADRP